MSINPTTAEQIPMEIQIGELYEKFSCRINCPYVHFFTDP
jgi:hypothetical protein